MTQNTDIAVELERISLENEIMREGLLATDETFHNLTSEVLRLAQENTKMRSALAVLTLTPAIRAFLQAKNPKALEQAEVALKGGEPPKAEGRFWVDDNPDSDPFPEGYAIVDETAGGIVAYAHDEYLARYILEILEGAPPNPGG